MLRRVALVCAILFLVAAAVLFTAMNQQPLEVDLAFGRLQMSSGLALLIAFSSGLLAGALWRSSWIARLLAERGRLRHALRLAERRMPHGAPSDPQGESGAIDAR